MVAIGDPAVMQCACPPIGVCGICFNRMLVSASVNPSVAGRKRGWLNEAAK